MKNAGIHCLVTNRAILLALSNEINSLKALKCVILMDEMIT